MARNHCTTLGLTRIPRGQEIRAWNALEFVNAKTLMPSGSVPCPRQRSPLRKNPVRFCERFLRTDIVPDAGHGPGVHRRASVEPLNEAAGLIRIITFGEVLMDQG